MQTLREIIKDAESAKKAIGHFNISTIEVLWSIFHAAQELNQPVIIGISEGERKFLGVRQTAALVQSIREEYNHPIFLNADHSYSFESVKSAVDAGFDAVIFDGARLPFEENIELTKECVAYARSVNPDILVEGELGYIGQSSKFLEAMPEEILKSGKTTTEQAKEFVGRTGVDLFAPSVGNVHGIIKTGNPDLDISLIRALREAAGVPLVLHGGSGIKDGDFTEAIDAGVAIVHINTEIRKAWRDAVVDALAENPDEVSPYKILASAKEAVEEVVRERIGLFSGR